ncbi:hypothetical protein [Acidiplasma aeolicum]|jgi:drug/metabolite transporter (DMT)-like permease|uniref:hypothetical protein n=1 Tax=Acidiplasma aeolicum TaxID=507754 RepID=UPI00371B0142
MQLLYIKNEMVSREKIFNMTGIYIIVGIILILIGGVFYLFWGIRYDGWGDVGLISFVSPVIAFGLLTIWLGEIKGKQTQIVKK